MADKAEDPRITRARLAGPEQVTKKRDGRREMAADRHHDRSGQRHERVGFVHPETKTESAIRRCA